MPRLSSRLHSFLLVETPLLADRSDTDLALAEELDTSEAPRVFGFRQAAITSLSVPCAQTLHERFFFHLHFPHLQLDELRTQLRCAKQVLWLWLAIDPSKKIPPVLSLGPRTQNMAHKVIHRLRQILAAFLPPALHQ